MTRKPKTEHEQVTNKDARKFITGLGLYFMQQSNEGSPIAALETCVDFVQLQSVKRMHSVNSSVTNC
jgi:hypothetical protein